MSKKVSKETIIRTVIMVIALLNQFLIMSGKNPLPFSNDELYNGLSAVASAATTVWVWWKNNSFTPAAIRADDYMKKLKGDK